MQAIDTVYTYDPLDETQWIIWPWCWYLLEQGIVDIEL